MFNIVQSLKDRFTPTEKLQQEEDTLMSAIEEDEKREHPILPQSIYYRQPDVTKELIRRNKQQ